MLTKSLFGLALSLLAVAFAWPAVPARVLAQDDDPMARGEAITTREGRVQVVEGILHPERADFYRLVGVQPGDILYVYVKRTSGNLDPIVAVANQDIEGRLLIDAFWEQVGLTIQQGADPLDALPKIYGSLFVAWDDDSGTGYDASLEHQFLSEGDYQLVVTGSPASQDTFGEYQMVVGVNEPEVLSGSARRRGSLVAIHDREMSQAGQAVQVIEGEFTEDRAEESLTLVELGLGDQLNVYADSPDGSLRPVLLLYDYGRKLVASDNLGGQKETSLLSHRFRKEGKGYQLRVLGYSGTSTPATGQYRLVLTLNAAEEAVAGAIPRGQPVVKEPIPVAVGVKLQQITNVNQVAENFGAVAELTMEWLDPLLAFSPDTCHCSFRTFTGDSFSSFADKAEIDWPQFTIYNQQGNRWVQNRNVVLWPDGRAAYQERFTTDFQAPDFDFTKFPFDTQQFYMRVHSLYPAEFFVFEASDDLSGIGDQLGEEEWRVIDSATEVTILDGRSHFALRFEVKRYLQFYIFRIFVPIFLIIIVSWFTFFLKDYGKRVDVAGANLLVFVAFNFTVSGDLPRLGYLTFMDAVLIGVFALSALVVVFNVYLKRLELAGKGERAARIDRYSIWIYPLAYAVGTAIAYYLFLAA